MILGGVAVKSKKVLSVMLSIVSVAILCCSSFVSSASMFFIDGNATICPGTTKNYVDEENYNYAWIDDAVMRDSTTSVTPLSFHPVTDYPYSHTAEEFIQECTNYAALFNVSEAVLESSMMQTLETSYYALLASGAIKSNEQEMRAYNESQGIDYSNTANMQSTTVRVYTTLVYALLKSDIASSVLKQDIEIPRGTSLEGAVVIYLSKVCGMNVPVTVDSLESFAYVFANKYVLEESELPVSDDPSRDEVYYWIKVSAASKQGYDVPTDTPYLEVTSQQMEYVTYAYYASILTSKYDVHVSPELLKKAILSADSNSEISKLVIMSMLDSVNAEYSDSESFEALFENAKTEGFFELEDDFYSDIYNYEVEVSTNSTEVWITAFLVASQLGDADITNAKTYINGQLVDNLSTNCIKLTGDSTKFIVRTEYTDDSRADSAEYTFTVKKTLAGSNSVDLTDSVDDIIDSVKDSISEYIPDSTTSAYEYSTDGATTSPNTTNGYATNATTYAIGEAFDFSALNSNFLETYPTDANGEVEMTSDPLATTTAETTSQQIQSVLSGVTQTLKDKPEYVATPIGLLAVGASAGYVFFRRKRNDDVISQNENISEIEEIEID